MSTDYYLVDREGKRSLDIHKLGYAFREGRIGTAITSEDFLADIREDEQERERCGEGVDYWRDWPVEAVAAWMRDAEGAVVVETEHTLDLPPWWEGSDDYDLEWRHMRYTALPTKGLEWGFSRDAGIMHSEPPDYVGGEEGA